MTPRCNKPCGGSPGCTTFCTLLVGHEGECRWDAGEQVRWNAEVEAATKDEDA